MRGKLSAALVAAAALGCAREPDGAQAPARARGITTAATLTEVPVPAEPDRMALAELLAAAPADTPTPTAKDGTLVGSNTGLEEDALPPSVDASVGTPQAHLVAGAPEIQPLLSSPAIERAAREQIYWELMKKCRGPDGEAPTPEVITLVFTIRADGSVDPASAAASAAEARYEATAACVLREFSAIPFRGPAAALATEARIIVTWPSVD
jgi:hypothetical protein